MLAVVIVITIVIVLVCRRYRSRTYSPTKAERKKGGVTVTELTGTPKVQLPGQKDEDSKMPELEQDERADLDIDVVEAKPSL